MIIRTATITDIPQIQVVRNSVKENMLSNPGLVTDRDCEVYLVERGCGWVAEEECFVVGFSIVDLVDNNVWALFLHPDFERRGIGRLLHDTMLNWYFGQTKEAIWLGTSPNTRAEQFYRTAGWTENGTHGKGEIKFSMSFEDWANRSKSLPTL